MQTFIKRYFIFIFIGIILLTGINVHAEETDKDAYTSTVQLNYGYKFTDGSLDVWGTCPAVIVNEKTAVSFDISAYDYSELLMAKKPGYDTLGIPIETATQNACYMLYNGNSYVNVTEVIRSETILGNMVILKTEEPIGTPVKFSPVSKLNDEEIYATGFSNSLMDNLHYAKQENILKQNVLITSEEEQYLRFSIESQESFKGSALINNHNEMYGLIIGTEDGGTALTIKALEQLLDTYNIVYKIADPIVPIDKTALSSATDAASKVESDGIVYTEESIEFFKESYKKANETYYNENATQKQIDEATKNLENAILNLKEDPPKKHYGLIITLIIVGIILIAGIVIFILAMKDKDFIYKLLGIKKKEEIDLFTYQNNGPSTSSFIDNDTPIEGLDDIPQPQPVPAQPVQLAQPVQQVQTVQPEQPAIQPTQEKEKPKAPKTEKPAEKYEGKQKRDKSDKHTFSNNFQGGYIYEDRSDAPANSGTAVADTSVLRSDISSNDEIVGAPYVIRVKNKERFIITHNQFSIGRDYDVDYRIPENPYIGKTHCRFTEVGGQWYIVDNKSSNKTLVNGIEVEPYKSVPIYDKTEIVLANEKFIFRIINDAVSAVPIPVSGTDTLRSPGFTQEEVNSSPEDPGTNVLTAGEIPDNLKIPYLIIKKKKIKLNEFPFSVGRSKKASYKYTNESAVSREHFIITKENNKYYIRDNNTPNGTFLNDEPLDQNEEYILNDSDEIRVLQDVFVFHV